MDVVCAFHQSLVVLLVLRVPKGFESTKGLSNELAPHNNIKHYGEQRCFFCLSV